MENYGNDGHEENCTFSRDGQETKEEEGGGRREKQRRKKRITGIR
jgi:hypothetical protein